MNWLPDGWVVRMEQDPPFPNAIGVIVSPDGRKHFSIRGDDPVVWDFIAALLADEPRYTITDKGRAMLGKGK